MNAEIISVGTELLLGHTVNTNATYVARELAALGIDLMHVHAVGDNPDRLEHALREALTRCDIIITTGGLGPTEDDLTKETVARVAKTPLVPHQDSLDRLQTFFRDRAMTPNQLKQAHMPEGCTVFPNNSGTAPGCAVRTAAGKHILMLPGPPSELKPMLSGRAAPFLASLLAADEHTVIHSTMIRTFGVGEGSGAAAIADLTTGTNPTAATYTTDNEMFVRVTAKAATLEAARALCAPVVNDIARRFGDRIYAIVEDDTPISLEHTVARELTVRKLTLAVAESCTGGLLAKRLTDIPGSSAFFLAGLVTYANAMKTALLGVDPELIERLGAVSEPVARAMAEGVRQRCGTDYGIGITGVAGPDGGTPEKPVGLVHIALATPDGTSLRTMTPFGRTHDRQWLRERAASEALDMLRRAVLGLGEREVF